MPAAAWSFAWPIIEANPILAEKVVLRIANRLDFDRKEYLPLLTEKQLADLYLKVHSFFPPETDPDFSRGGFVSPPQSVVHFRGDIIGALEARGTETACNELLRWRLLYHEKACGCVGAITTPGRVSGASHGFRPCP